MGGLDVVSPLSFSVYSTHRLLFWFCSFFTVRDMFSLFDSIDTYNNLSSMHPSSSTGLPRQTKPPLHPRALASVVERIWPVPGVQLAQHNEHLEVCPQPHGRVFHTQSRHPLPHLFQHQCPLTGRQLEHRSLPHMLHLFRVLDCVHYARVRME